MIKISVNVNKMCMQEKCEFISFLYNNYEEADYDFLRKLTGLAASTVRNYRYRGDKTFTEEKSKKFETYVRIVEKQQDSFVIYEDEADFLRYQDKVPTTYICEIYCGDTLLYTKVGKSIHLHNRMKEHSRNKKYGSDKVIVKKVYAFEDEEESLIMESLMRKYFKNIYKENFVRNDRFANIHMSEEDEEKIVEIYNKLMGMGID